MTSPLSLPPLAASAPQARALARSPATQDPATVMKAAKDFEAMALGELLQPMFDTVDTAGGLTGGGPGEEAWKPMMVQEYAKQIANHGGLGLAKPIYEAMMRAQQDATGDKGP